MSGIRVRLQSGKVLTLGASVDRGNEAAIFEHPTNPGALVKLYRAPTDLHGKKLRAFLNHPPVNHRRKDGGLPFAFPTELVLDIVSGAVRGFLMPRVRGMPLYCVWNPQLAPRSDLDYRVSVARNICRTLQAVHDAGYVAGDLSPQNCLVHGENVSFIDCDSWGRGTRFPCLVGTPDWTAPEIQGPAFTTTPRTPLTDAFGCAVIVWQLLHEGFHPCFGCWAGAGNAPSLPECIRRGVFPAARPSAGWQPVPSVPPFANLPQRVQDLCLRVFGPVDPSSRPSPEEWADALEACRTKFAKARRQRKAIAGLVAAPLQRLAARFSPRPPPAPLVPPKKARRPRVKPTVSPKHLRRKAAPRPGSPKPPVPPWWPPPAPPVPQAPPPTPRRGWRLPGPRVWGWAVAALLLIALFVGVLRLSAWLRQAARQEKYPDVNPREERYLGGKPSPRLWDELRKAPGKSTRVN
jgi:serine/threonine protein kinase